MIDPTIFKAYDVRGTYPDQIDEEAAYAIGAAFIAHFGVPGIAVGRDMRLSSPALQVNSYGKIRLRLTDGAYTAWLSVTDLRLYKDDQVTPRPELVGQIAARIAKGARVIVAVGLSRPWQKLDDTAERHWLQVNNIHLEDDPAWHERAMPA